MRGKLAALKAREAIAQGGALGNQPPALEAMKARRADSLSTLYRLESKQVLAFLPPFRTSFTTDAAFPWLCPGLLPPGPSGRLRSRYGETS
jgi:hypothetical protein